MESTDPKARGKKEMFKKDVHRKTLSPSCVWFDWFQYIATVLFQMFQIRTNGRDEKAYTTYLIFNLLEERWNERGEEKREGEEKRKTSSPNRK